MTNVRANKILPGQLESGTPLPAMLLLDVPVCWETQLEKVLCWIWIHFVSTRRMVLIPRALETVLLRLHASSWSSVRESMSRDQ